jgi:uncharacterized protein (DUF433 family)
MTAALLKRRAAPTSSSPVGARIEDFLESFPGVTREQVEMVLRHAERSLAVA